jgi:outer membrane protein assembly factor BamA
VAMLKRLLFSVFVLLLGSLCAQNCVSLKEQKTKPAPIEQISFSNDGLLDREKESEIIKLTRNQTVDPASVAESMRSIAEEAAEKVRVAYQNQGYFKVKVSAQAVPFFADKSQYDINVNIGPVGKQYRLGYLNITNAASFPTQQLRDLFALQSGEIFSREKIAEGLEKLRRFYGSQGYVNFTAVPNTELDDDNAIVNLTINVDEGKQFRLRNVKVLGLDPDAEARVLGEVEIKQGDVYDQHWLEQSIAKFKDLGPYPPPHGGTELDERDGLIDVVLDFRKLVVCSTVTP